MKRTPCAVVRYTPLTSTLIFMEFVCGAMPVHLERAADIAECRRDCNAGGMGWLRLPLSKNPVETRMEEARKAASAAAQRAADPELLAHYSKHVDSTAVLAALEQGDRSWQSPAFEARLGGLACRNRAC